MCVYCAFKESDCVPILGAMENWTPKWPVAASAREAGADGALLISPYYNKPIQDGIFRHCKMIAAAVD
jgi:dihydrodipicolinate synthase/N-acetylneuraminate lyase